MNAQDTCIHWVGSTENWIVPTNSKLSTMYAVPLVEEAVLETAFGTIFSDMLRLTKTCAINCTSRLAQRVALSQTSLNPEWKPYLWSPGVIKSPASCANNGVRFFDSTEHTLLLHKYVPELASIGIIESRVPGEAYEVDGAVCGGNVVFLTPLKQHWNGESDRILNYTPSGFLPGMRDAAVMAIKALGIDNCCFCIEFRRSGTVWKVIDAHARLGEDNGLPELLKLAEDDRYPLSVIDTLFRQSCIVKEGAFAAS